MSVRRLAPKELQPASFTFSDENLAWAKAQIAKYPSGRQASAVIAIMWRVQEQHEGWVSEAAIRAVADLLEMPYIRVLEVATFYTMFQLQPVGKKAHVQVCGTTPCRLRGAGDIIEVCQSRIHHDPFHLSKDGNFSWEEVECLGACVNAPMVLIWKGPDQGKLRQGARRICLRQSAEAGSADRPSVLGAGGRPDHAEGIPMTRDGTSPGNGPQGESAMKHWRYIGLHAVTAAAFIFLLQRYALSATLESSLLWALTFGGCAAGLAYSQSNR
jgi:NADH-quinone oxidoreductase subunit E